MRLLILTDGTEGDSGMREITRALPARVDANAADWLPIADHAVIA